MEARIQIAEAVATQVQLSETRMAKNAEYLTARSFQLRNQLPEVPLGFGNKAWAAIVFVDLRQSSQRAERLSERETYLTMHAFLPTMALIVQELGGYTVGYRGDGLFGAFGLSIEGSNTATLDESSELQSAVDCGKAMMEAIDDAVSPALEQHDVEGDLRVGCGVDVGKIVLTRIGLETNSEITAYGNAVNKASKLSCGNSEVVVSRGAKNLFPTSQNGKLSFKRHSKLDGLRVLFPEGYRVIADTRYMVG